MILIDFFFIQNDDIIAHPQANTEESFQLQANKPMSRQGLQTVRFPANKSSSRGPVHLQGEHNKTESYPHTHTHTQAQSI